MRANVLLCLPLILAACSPITLGSDTTGKSGHLTFNAVSSSSDCGLFGCAIDKPVLEGSLISIEAKGGDSNTRYTMQLNPSSLGTTTSREDCSCNQSSGNSSTSETVDPGAACKPGETKSCTVRGDIQTLGSGAATVEVLGADGKVFDSVAVSIQQADKVAVSVTVNDKAVSAAADGSYALHVGDKIQIHSAVSAGGKPLLFSEHGLVPSYSDPSIVDSDKSVLLGDTDIEYAIARGAGTATTTMTAHGAAATVTFRVSP